MKEKQIEGQVNMQLVSLLSLLFLPRTNVSLQYISTIETFSWPKRYENIVYKYMERKIKTKDGNKIRFSLASNFFFSGVG